MLRTFTGIGIALALVGSAHAEQVLVNTAGKSPRAIRAEIYKAAEKVCRPNGIDLDVTYESDCVEATASYALAQAHLTASIMTSSIH